MLKQKAKGANVNLFAKTLSQDYIGEFEDLNTKK